MTVDAAATRPMRADARRNYDAIVRVAGEAFAEKGATASLDDIACRAGVGPGTLYRHFPNRDELLAAVLRENREDLARRAEACQASADALVSLEDWLFQVAVHNSAFQGLPDSIADSLRASGPLAMSCQSLLETTRGLLDRAQRAGAVRADVTADDLFTIAGSLAWSADKAGNDAGVVRRLLAAFMRGIAAEPSSR